MSLLWPAALASFLAVPLLVFGYTRLMRRRAQLQAEMGTMGMPLMRSGRAIGWRRHVPPLLFVLGIMFLFFGLARPQATVALPRREGTVILAFDVSNSMKAKDLKPTRIAAAKRAASAFVRKQPSSIKIGVVAFSSGGFVVQPPTKTRPDVLDAIKRLSTRGPTSIGQGILTSLGAIRGKPIALDRDALANGAPQPGVRFVGSAAVVLLSDGENTSRLDPLAVAPIASQAGVRIFPIGIGSAGGAVLDIDGFRVATHLDARLLRGIAARSQGKYFRARDTASLNRIYNTLDLQLTVNGKKTEVTALFAGTGLSLFLAGAALSMRWYGRAL